MGRTALPDTGRRARQARSEPPSGAAWHVRSTEDALRALSSSQANGLSEAEASRRLAEGGPNEIEQALRHTPLRMLAAQLSSSMILVLLAAALVSGIVGDLADTVAILVIVLLNAVIGVVQEYRAERSVAALRRLAAPVARVLRDGLDGSVPASEIVPGDIVRLEAGDVVTADARVLGTVDLQLDEAPLTGESQPILKHTETLEDAELPIGDRRNMVYSGTLVTSGHGEGLVVATAMDTELGRIADLLQREESVKAPLQVRLSRLGKNLAYAVLAISAVVFGAGLLRGEPVLLMFLTALSLAVAAIPEALPAVVSISLALGARKMIRHRALVRNLPAVETLGSVTTICSDKTGTLTRNEMRVEAVVAAGQRAERLSSTPLAGGPWDLLARAIALNNDARPSADGTGFQGDPTEVALYEAGQGAGFQKRELERETPRVGELAFEGSRRRMTTLHSLPEGVMAFVKGAPETVLERCRDALSTEGNAALDAAAVLDEADRLAAEGYRVLAFAYRRFDSMPETGLADEIESRLTYLGLVALLDPPRDEAAGAVEECQRAGITPIMITGDHPATALTIALRLGIARPGDVALTGSELEALSPEELSDRVRETRVYARFSPEQKINLVRTLQEQGEFVAMTGDGVNDAPALKRAEIGIAMGLQGTDVAREAADMVLMDDNFSTIVTAVREGRRVFDNIRKFVKYTLTSNAGEIWTLFLAPFLGLPIPLLPIQILWINLVTDGLPGLAFAVQPEERNLMQRRPRLPGESIFAGGMWQHIVWVGLLIGGLSIGAQAWAVGAGSEN